MKNPLGNLMQQAQEFQENMQKAQDELAAMEVNGESGGGMVKIVMTGKREVRKIEIDDSAIEDKDMLQDLIAAAFNDAVHRVDKLKQDKMKDMTSGITLPGGMQMPF